MASDRGTERRASFEAPPNIALIKYWGVRDERLHLPYNSSLSVTLDRFRTRTTVAFDPGAPSDRFRLDGVDQSGAPLDAVVEMLDRVRAVAGRTARARVDSSNNFPTASGLASSASGFAALAGASAAAAGLRWGPKRLSQLARTGSGSACRSLFGGFVLWDAGERADGADCFARPVLPPEHWPALRDEVLLLEDAPVKSVRSAVAMQRTVATSPHFRARLAEIPDRLEALVRALRRRDAPDCFRLVMEECDSFRRVCEETDPPLDYLSPTSRRLLGAVRSLNRAEGEPVVGYTHDAGAHLHLFTLAATLPRLRRALRGIPGVRARYTLRPGPGAHPWAGGAGRSARVS